jgi:putative nucleotidyltransferase with HDIG domain
MLLKFLKKLDYTRALFHLTLPPSIIFITFYHYPLKVLLPATVIAYLLWYGIYKTFPIKTLEDARRVVLYLITLLLVIVAKCLENHFSEFSYLIFVGSIVGVLTANFLRRERSVSVIFLLALLIFLATKNPFYALGIFLGNAIAEDIYANYRNVLAEIGGVAIGNLIFISLIIAYLLITHPQMIIKVLVYYYPLSVLVGTLLIFGIEKILNLLPFMYSDEKLLNLMNLSNPLLKEMLLKAPGTYHHSVMVSLIAEALAEKIGADPIITKIGAIFHDIGKLVRPSYFIENISNGENPHMKIAPEVSAAIIKNHVKEGLNLAKKYNLPKEIIPFIPEHQGTKLIKYFYYQAKKKNKNIDEKKFRYDGPIPQSKETAIVMIADTVEATIRALKNPSPEDIQMVVENTIKNLKEEHQLIESGLTEKDLEKIKTLLIEIIKSYYHERIKYPSLKN